MDSNDRERIHEAKEELGKFFNEDELRDFPFLILANKIDLPNSYSVNEVTEHLGLNQRRNIKWYIQPICAKTGQGIIEGLDWVFKIIFLNFY